MSDWIKKSTKYTDIFYSSDRDLKRFNRYVGTRGWPLPVKGEGEVDDITDKVMDLLKHKPEGFRTSIFIYPGKKDIIGAYPAKNALAPKAYYDHGKKAIYVSTEDLTRNMLAHELGHAILSARQGNLMSQKEQEPLVKEMERLFGKR